jgi:hypothetical protein
MKTILHVLSAALLIAFGSSAWAQNNFPKCFATIQERLDALGDAGKQQFNIAILRQDIKDYDIGKLPDVVADANKTKAFKLVYESLSEFTDLAGNTLSAKGMKGYGRYGPCIIKADGTDTVGHLKEAFTRSGAFKGKDFDDVMKQLADDARFELDAPNRTFVSKISGLKFGPETYNQGEKHAINHVLRGHIENDFSAGAGKSLFKSAEEFFSLIDDAWKSQNKVSIGANGWEFDFAPRIIGTANQTKLRFFVNPETYSAVRFR